MGQLIAKIITNPKVVGKVVPSSVIGNIGKSIVQLIIRC